MGKPPNYVIFQKLSHKYMKFPNSQSDSFRKTTVSTGLLKECWGEYGVGHKNCEKIIQELDANFIQETNDYNDYREHISTYPKILAKHLISMKDPKRLKGRKHEPKYTYKTQGYKENDNSNY